MTIGKLQEAGLTAPLPLFLPVTHQLDIEAARKNGCKLAQYGLGGVCLPLCQQPSDWPVRPSREADQSFARRGEIGDANCRICCSASGEIRAADQSQKVAIPNLALHQQDNPVRLGCAARRAIAAARLAAARERHLASDDRLHTPRGTGRGKLERSEEVAGVGDRHSRHVLSLAQPGRLLDRDRPGGQRIGGVNAQMDKISESHAGNIAPTADEFTRLARSPRCIETSSVFSNNLSKCPDLIITGPKLARADSTRRDPGIAKPPTAARALAKRGLSH